MDETLAWNFCPFRSPSWEQLTSREQSVRFSQHLARLLFELARPGAPIRAIQEWMGHADISTTQIYAHYAPDPTGGVAFAQRPSANLRLRPRRT